MPRGIRVGAHEAMIVRARVYRTVPVLERRVSEERLRARHGGHLLAPGVWQEETDGSGPIVRAACRACGSALVVEVNEATGAIRVEPPTKSCAGWPT